MKGPDGEALPDVTVSPKGTTNGAATTITTINVTLASDVQSLNDVIVIGCQAVQRRDATGSVSWVSAPQIKDVPRL